MGEDRTPRPWEIYRHFKDKIYQVIAVAEYVEAQEQLVIYQAMYGDFKIFARSLRMFTSEVDHEKYPDVTQKYCFELISERAAEKHQSEETQNVVNPDLLEFLDAKTMDEKINILFHIRKRIDQGIIEQIAASLDLVLEEGTPEQHLDVIEMYLKTRARFENLRLR